MPLKIIDHGSHEYEMMVALRDQILRKPLGLHFSDQELTEEKNHLLIGAFEDENILGCCMLVQINPKTVRLRQMAVWDTLQGKGIGRAIIFFAENIARDRGIERVEMHARLPVVGFYQKMGYQVCSDVFEEVLIPHVVMEKRIA